MSRGAIIILLVNKGTPDELVYGNEKLNKKIDALSAKYKAIKNDASYISRNVLLEVG